MERADAELIARALEMGKGKNPAELRRVTGVSESSWRRWRGGDVRDLTPLTRGRLEDFVEGEQAPRVNHGDRGDRRLGYVDGLAEAASAVEILAMGLRQKIAALRASNVPAAHGNDRPTAAAPPPAAASEPRGRTPEQLQVMEDSDHIRAAEQAEKAAARRRRKSQGKRESES